MTWQKEKLEVIKRKLVYDGSPYLKIFKDKIMLPSNKIIDDYH